MNRNDQIKLSCVQALEKGFVPATGGWSRSKASELLSTMIERTRPALPVSTQPAEVYDAILDILVGFEDAEARYVPVWAKQLLTGKGR